MRKIFKKHLHIHISFKQKKRRINIGLILVVIIASATTWFLAEFIVFQLNKINDNYNKVSLGVVGEWRPEARAQAHQPANPNANQETINLLNYFYDLPNRADNKVLSSQHLTHNVANISSGYNSFAVDLNTQTGKWVAMIGSGYWTNTPSQITSANQIFIDYWNNGGLITLDMHPDNPWTGGDSWDTSGVNFQDLTTPGTSAYNIWMAQLSIIADGFQELENNGVVVLWRPFHEMNFGWFWWGDKSNFTEVWQYMFDYFTHIRGINNLLWVYSPSSNGGTDCLDYYPGDGYVDIVAQDSYVNNIAGSGVVNSCYNDLVTIGKPFAFGEFGPQTRDGTYDNMITINGIRSNFPQTTYITYWHSWTGASVAIIDGRNAQGFLDDPWVITREEVILTPATCSDNTPYNTCTTRTDDGAMYCDGSGQIVEDCVQCDFCFGGWTCNTVTRQCEAPSGDGYYVRPLGGNYGLEDGSSYVNAFDGFADLFNTITPAAGDVIYVAGMHRETMTFPDNMKGDSITDIYFKSCETAYGASIDDPGNIRSTELITDWSVYSGNIYRAATTRSYVYGYIWYPGGNAVLSYRASTPTGLADQQTIRPHGTNVVYVRWDAAGGNPANVPDLEVPARLNSIAFGTGNEHITIQGINLYGGSGLDGNEFVDGNFYAYKAPISLVIGDRYGGASYITVKDLEIAYCGMSWFNRGHYNTWENLHVHDVGFGGYAGGRHPGSGYVGFVDPAWDPSTSHYTVRRCRIYDVGQKEGPGGDLECLGINTVQDVILEDNYFGPSKLAANGKHKSQQIGANMVRNFTVVRNYFHASGYHVITFAACCSTRATNWDSPDDHWGSGNVIFAHNIIDGWGTNPDPDVNRCNDMANSSYTAIFAGCGNCTSMAASVHDYGYQRIYNNLFINFPNGSTHPYYKVSGSGGDPDCFDGGNYWGGWHKDYAIYVSPDNSYTTYSEFRIDNNIFIPNNPNSEVGVLYPRIRPEAVSGAYSISNNHFYVPSQLGSRGSIISDTTTGSWRGFAYNEVSDWEAAVAYLAAGNLDVNISHGLTSIAGGPANSKALTAGSLLIDAGINLGAPGNNPLVGTDMNYYLAPKPTQSWDPGQAIISDTGLMINYGESPLYEIGPIIYDDGSSPTCQSLSHNCCTSCQAGTAQSAYDSDCSGAQVCCGNCTDPATELSVGTHQITLTVTDADGRTAYNTIELIIQPIGTFSVSLVVNDPNYMEDETMHFTAVPVGGVPGYSYTWEVDNSEFASTDVPMVSVSASDWGPGSYQVTVIATDSVNNTAEDTITITITELFTGDAYYVTQDGAGARNGTSLANAWSVDNFNDSGNWNSAVNASDGYIGPGDIVYFSGIIIEEIWPRGSGNSGNYITLDGWENGTCNPVANNGCPSAVKVDRDSGERTHYTRVGINVYGNGQDYLIVQDFDFISGIAGIANAPSSGGNHSDHWIIRRNNFENLDSRGFTYAGGYEDAYITIGGARGDGNRFHNIADGDQSSASAAITFSNANDIVVSYNHIYNDDSLSILPSGPDALVVMRAKRLLMEYNTIYNMGEDGVDFKTDTPDLVTHTRDVIVRFNYIDTTQEAGIKLQGTYNQNGYVYGNFVTNAGAHTGIQVNRGFDYAYIWSNIVEEGYTTGISVSDGRSGDVYYDQDYSWILNNTIVRNVNRPEAYSSRKSTGIIGNDYAVIKNNILYYNQPGWDSYRYQIYYPDGPIGSMTVDYNLYYYTAFLKPQVLSDTEITSADSFPYIINGQSFDANGLEADPLFVDPSNGDFSLQATSPAINSGEPIPEPESWDPPTIQGVDYSAILDFDLVIDPRNTNFFAIPPVVTMVHQNDHGSGWERGAYAYTGDSSPDTTTPVVTDFRVDNGSAVINWTVTDSGGSHLDRIEIWRAPDNGGVPGTWSELTGLRQNIASQNIDTHTGEATDYPSVGTWWYGLYAVDQDGNCITERNRDCTSGAWNGQPEWGPDQITVISDDTEFIKGNAMGYVRRAESSGFVYRENGISKDPFQSIKDHGSNYAMIEIWDGDNYRDLGEVLELANRAKAAGLNILLNFFYQDGFEHTIPPGWPTTLDPLKIKVYNYTQEILGAFRDNGTPPTIVKVGNEIDHDGGFLKPIGRYDTIAFYELLKSGCTAVRDFDSSIKVAIHTAHSAGNNYMMQRAIDRGVPYDIYAVSYYPTWGGRIASLSGRLNEWDDIGKEILITETSGVSWTSQNFDWRENLNASATGYTETPEDGGRWFRDIIVILKSNPLGLGIITWPTDTVACPAIVSRWDHCSWWNSETGNFVWQVADGFQD